MSSSSKPRSEPPPEPAAAKAPFEHVVAAQRARVYRYCLTLMRDRTRAEDLFQETFVEAFRGYSGFRGDANVATWLLTIARNKAFRMRRLKVGEPEHTEDLMALGLRAGWGSGDALDEALDAETVRTRMRAGLDRLSDIDREVIVLRDLEELSTRESAEVLEISESAVRVRLHRARLKLMACLRQQGPFDAQ